MMGARKIHLWPALLLVLLALAMALPLQAQPATNGNAAQPQHTANAAAAAVEQEVSAVLVDKSARTLKLLNDGVTLREYAISLGKQPRGHKLYEGDQRTPEGRYTLDWRNPNSKFYRSIHVSYPNSRDRARASRLGKSPGGNIMIHGIPEKFEYAPWLYTGKDWTDGCIAVTNTEMDEIWRMVDDGTPIVILP